MSKDFFNIDAIDDAMLRAERNKARELRKSRWWQQKTSTGTCWYCGQKVDTVPEATTEPLPA